MCRRKAAWELTIGGTVIPNAGAWPPPFQDLTETQEHTLDLPTILPHGARVNPNSATFCSGAHM